jgi:hypothetical protein
MAGDADVHHLEGQLARPMTDDETIALRVTVIGGGQRYADDYQMIWRGLPPLFAAV